MEIGLTRQHPNTIRLQSRLVMGRLARLVMRVRGEIFTYRQISHGYMKKMVGTKPSSPKARSTR
jgi:hypothetical protein